MATPTSIEASTHAPHSTYSNKCPFLKQRSTINDLISILYMTTFNSYTCLPCGLSLLNTQLKGNGLTLLMLTKNK